MCFSAMVKQDLKRLGIQFKARIDYHAFTEVFEARLKGQKIIIPRALEDQFKSEACVRDYQEQQQVKDEQELFKQQKRLADAKRALSEKPTKKAAEEERIATKKTAALKERIVRRKSETLIEADSQIFPYHYAPIIRVEKGERIIEPRRYLLRPRGQGEDFDRKFSGCYNAREDSLEKVFFWKQIFGRNHALLVISDFFENVSEHTYLKRELKAGEKEKNIVLRFHPRGTQEMYIPCLFDEAKTSDGFTLKSFALITTEPPPEIQATGHDRSPIFLDPSAIDDWLNPSGKSVQELHQILQRRHVPYYEHSLVA